MQPGGIPTDEVVIASCARRVWRGYVPGLTRDDLMQEGRIALWLAQQLGRVPEEPEHRRRYIITRVTGAMRDAVGRAHRQLPMACGDGDCDAPPEPASAAAPDARMQMRQLVAFVTRRGSERMKQCLEMLADGIPCNEVADRMGVTPTRVGQWRREARSCAAAFR